MILTCLTCRENTLTRPYTRLLDAAKDPDGIRFVGKNIFHPGINRPKPDEFLANDDVVEIVNDLQLRMVL